MRSGALRGHRVHHINNVIQRFVVCVQSAGELIPILNPPFDHLGDRHFGPRGLVIGLIGFRTSGRARLPTQASNTRRILAVRSSPASVSAHDAALMLIAPCFYRQCMASRERDAIHLDSRRRICGTPC